MEWYRIVNFILQSTYLLIHFLFMLHIIKMRRPTPLWNWYIICAAALWLWVLGRFMETIIYLFFPAENDAYVFAANFQYIGNTTAVCAYLIWNLYLAGYDRLASNRLFQAFLFLSPVVTCALVFTNQYHHLIYRRLEMGQRVVHGQLFAFCVIWTYLILTAGYIISIIYTFRAGRDIMKRFVMFSIFPLLPAAVTLIRSVSGIDKLDYTPVFMAVSFFLLYLIVFQYNYTNIIASSVQTVVEQSAHPILIYDPQKGSFQYRNRMARQLKAETEEALVSHLSAPGSEEITLDGKHLKVAVTQIPEKELFIITISDLTETAARQADLDETIHELESANEALDEQNRNYNAYLEFLYQTEGLREKQEAVARTYESLPLVFRQMTENFQTAREDPDRAEKALRDNLALSRTSIASIRKTVAQLKEG